MTINISIRPKKPHPCNTRRWKQHCDAMMKATTEQLKRENSDGWKRMMHLARLAGGS